MDLAAVGVFLVSLGIAVPAFLGQITGAGFRRRLKKLRENKKEELVDFAFEGFFKIIRRKEFGTGQPRHEKEDREKVTKLVNELYIKKREEEAEHDKIKELFKYQKWSCILLLVSGLAFILFGLFDNVSENYISLACIGAFLGIVTMLYFLWLSFTINENWVKEDLA